MAQEDNATDQPVEDHTPRVRVAVEIGIRLGAIVLLVGACVMIVAPFLGLVVWALILAIAADGPFETLCRWLRGRRKLAAVVAVVLSLFAIIGPMVWLSETLISGAQHLASDLSDGTLTIPPPEPKVADWPVVGGRIFEAWTLASGNLTEAVSNFGPQLKAVSRWLLTAGASVGTGVLQLLGSVLIAGVLLARREWRTQAVERFAIRMSGPEKGPQLAHLGNATVRSVVQGIVGVACLQAILAGAGFVVAGVPAAGLWALLVLVAAVIQLPVAIVMVPPVLYAFSSMDGLPAILLTVWCVVISLLDNVLKPMLFGRGVEVPSLVIFVGALGGMLAMGIVGLFLGSVVLAVGFALFKAWLDEAVPA